MTTQAFTIDLPLYLPSWQLIFQWYQSMVSFPPVRDPVPDFPSGLAVPLLSFPCTWTMTTCEFWSPGQDPSFAYFLPLRLMHGIQGGVRSLCTRPAHQVARPPWSIQIYLPSAGGFWAGLQRPQALIHAAGCFQTLRQAPSWKASRSSTPVPCWSDGGPWTQPGSRATFGDTM